MAEERVRYSDSDLAEFKQELGKQDMEKCVVMVPGN